MSYFHECSGLFGDANIFSEHPQATEYESALLWDTALYDVSARLIPDSTFSRGVPKLTILNGVPKLDIVPARVSDRLPPGRYFWIGMFHTHFGHFMISTLSRLWALKGTDVSSWTFIYVGGEPDVLFRMEYVRDAFTALGIQVSQLRRVNGPLLIPTVLVAQPSFIENFGAHPAYRETLSTIRDTLLPDTEASVGSNIPVYVTKQHVTAGVRGIANEHEATAILSSEGVTIANPETLSFKQQVAFWCANRVVIGFGSSAFHLATFATNRRLICLSHDRLASANQVILDLLAGNHNLHLQASHGIVSEGPQGSFTDLLRITDPRAFARGVLELLADPKQARDGQMVAPEPRTVWPESVGYETFGVELARKGLASQSSDYEIDEGHNCTAQGALSGRLTGFYQCSTRRENNPWWQVELPSISRIYEVRIYNRAENPEVQFRLSRFYLSVSIDGLSWTPIYIHSGQPPEREPFRWQAVTDTSARFLRITLPTTTWLHLDQVEVFGRPMTALEGSTFIE